MFKNTSFLYGTPLAASDGHIGTVSDFYFDDLVWAVRYLVVDTGNWLTGRQVLLAPQAFGAFGPDGATLEVRLNKQTIINSPSIDTHLTVTRQHERDYYQYYNWPMYWENSSYLGGSGAPTLRPEVEREISDSGERAEDDPHLRSTKAVTGYDIVATDGHLGEITGFIIDSTSWAIESLAVKTGHWYSSKQIYISPTSVLIIHYGDASVEVKLSREDFVRAHEDEVARDGTCFANQVTNSSL